MTFSRWCLGSSWSSLVILGFVCCSGVEREFGEAGAAGQAAGDAGSPTLSQAGAEDTGGSGAPTNGGAGSGSAGGTAGVSAGGAENESGGAGGVPSEPVVKNPFAKGPCVVTPTGQGVEAFARGGDQKIYRRVLKGGADTGWNAISGLDASVVDARSDLDCGADNVATYLVASGNKPIGAYLRSVGSGDTFNAFARQLAPATFQGSVSIATSTLIAVQSQRIVVATANEDGSAYWFPSPTNNPILVSTASATAVSAFTQVATSVAAFSSPQELVLQRYTNTPTFSEWAEEPTLLAPPSGVPFELAPALCHTYYSSAGGDYPGRHLVVSAGGQLWHSLAGKFEDVFSAWQPMAELAVAAPPDCTAEADGTVHVVALGASGNIWHVYGKPGEFVTEDLGGF